MNEASQRNKRFYEKFWGNQGLVDYHLWSTWTIIRKISPKRALEVGCGNKPRIPVAGNYFLDINKGAVDRLKKAGGNATSFDLSAKLPFKDGQFDLVCAFEVLEHLKADKKVLTELARVLSKRGTALISFPLNMKYWVAYDEKVGHVRRYMPRNLPDFFGKAGLMIKKHSPIAVTWPNRWQSSLLIALVDRFPSLMVSVQGWLESAETSPLRKKLVLRKWTQDSIDDLGEETTALFVLKKR